MNKSIQRCKQSNENDNNNNNNNGKLSDYLQCIEPYHKIKNHKLINGKIMNPMVIYNGMIQSSSDDNSGTGIKCITGSMEHRMRTLPILALYQLIHCLVQCTFTNAVILTFGRHWCSPFQSNLIRRCLMFHSIWWTFDSIAHRSRASIKLSAYSIDYDRMVDLMAIDHNTQLVPSEHSCFNKRQAADLLQHAFQRFESIHNECKHSIFVFIINLYQYRTVRMANGKSKGKK